MANSIALFKQFVPLLDEVYKEASKTAVLDGRPELVAEVHAAGLDYLPKPVKPAALRALLSRHLVLRG